MAEVLAVVGVAASIIQLVDFSTRLAQRLDDFSPSGTLPYSLCHARTELCSFRDKVQQCEKVIGGDRLAARTLEALLSVLDGGQERIARLDDILAKVFPDSKDSWSERSRRALRSLQEDVNIKVITKDFQRCGQLLDIIRDAACTAESGSTLELTTSIPKIKDSTPGCLNEDIEALRRRCVDLEAQIYQQTLRLGRPRADSTARSQRYVCYTLATFVFLVFFISLVLALWWSIYHHDISGGFTMGAYIIATGGLPIGIVSYRHSSNCQCWTNPRDDTANTQALTDQARGEGTNDVNRG